jgi:hypothetical protein
MFAEQINARYEVQEESPKMWHLLMHTPPHVSTCRLSNGILPSLRRKTKRGNVTIVVETISLRVLRLSNRINRSVYE